MAKKRGRGEGTNGEGGGKYEKMREKRIKENTERMQKLGIFNLSLKLNATSTKNSRKASSSAASKTKVPPPLSDPPRRSSRLKTLPPVSYKELRPERNKPSENYEICIIEGTEPEIYTEEHEKLLGDCKMPWTLSVDGYGEDGKRIYDQVNGKSCHQCRQKTLGHHTHCCKCDIVQGQFCGDCLYMRYGENVIEANQNPNWICPVCRGICNCSRCRRGKGWTVTGAIYRKIANMVIFEWDRQHIHIPDVVNMGYKSVAHYLIQTRRHLADAKSKEILDVDENSDESPGHDLEDKEPYCSDSKQDGYNRIDDDDKDDGDYDGNGDDDDEEEDEDDEESN